MHALSRGVTAGTLLLLALTLSGTAPEAGRPRPTGAAAGPSALPGAAAIRAQIAKLPLAFEPNVGQASADVRYVSLGPSPRLELTDTEVRLTGPEARRGSKVVSLRLAGGARPSRVESQDELPGKVHHFDSNDPQQWRRDIPTFRRVAYRDVYPATDLVFHGSRDAVEFDFVLHPGASPGAIGIDVRGADAVALDGEDVVIRTGGDTLRMHAPVVYQDSATGRKLVDGRFSIQDSRIGFEIGAYDRARPLVIDPVVTYSTYLSGTGGENSIGVGVDAAGNIYAAMGTPPPQGRVVKLSADGQTLLYSVTLGDMSVHGFVADAAGNAYVVSTCGYDDSFTQFVCPTLKSLTSGRRLFRGDFGTYVTKLGPSGAILFSTSVGGFGSVLPGGIAVDAAGNMYVAAWGPYGGFPLTLPVPPFGRSAVVEAIAADYSRFLYVFEFPTDSLFEPGALAVDRAGAVYVTGIVHDGNFPTTPCVVQPTAGGGAVVAKIAPDASLAYATFFGNGAADPTAIAVDASGNAYLTGVAGPGLPTVNALQPTMAGGNSDAFVARLDATASSLVFSTYLGGSGDESAPAIALDGSGNIYLAGQTSSVDFPQQNALPPQFGQAGSNFVVKMTPDGRSLVYSTYFADAQTRVTALHATASGTVYLTGFTGSTAFPTVRPFQAALDGSGDAFIATLVSSEPRVFMTSPAAGATVNGTVWTDVWVENVAGTSNDFTLSVGGTVVAQGTASNHATLPWDSRSIPDGAITLTATVRDAAGDVGAATRDLIVRNGPELGVFITSPPAGAIVGRRSPEPGGEIVWSDIWVEGAARGPRTFTLASVGTTLATASASGNHVTLPWDSRLVPNGCRAIVATVRDAAGHVGTGTRDLFVLTGPPVDVFITSPPAGATVGGVVWSDIWVEGGGGRFTLLVGGTTLATGSVGNHVTLPWDSSRVADGPQEIVAWVFNATNQMGVGRRTVNIQNGLRAGAGTAPRSAIAPTQ